MHDPILGMAACGVLVAEVAALSCYHTETLAPAQRDSRPDLRRIAASRWCKNQGSVNCGFQP